MDFVNRLAMEFKLRPQQVQAAVELLDAGNTIPFIARYRKEATGSLDDQVLRELAERLEYLRNMEKRREEIAASLEEQGVMNDELQAQLAKAATLSELEDIYRPYRPKRRTRATVAKERGLEPLSLWLMLQQPGDPAAEAAKYIDPEKEVPDAETALAGARDILAETVSDSAEIRKELRALLNREGVIRSKAAKEEDSVYSMYYDFREPVRTIAAHRILAVNRGEREEFLKVSLEVPDEKALEVIRRAFVRNSTPAAQQVSEACGDAWERLVFPSLEREIRNDLTDRANVSAIKVFSDNLHQLLMQPPIKGKVTLGVDPGFRTGCKLAVVDENGKVLDTGVGYFTLPGNEARKAEAAKLIRDFAKKYGITAIAIGNGTASRESEQFIVSLLPELPGAAYMIVSEAGASVYSASKLAAEEFPDFDVTQRSAVSIARRMQDPLAELVKIDPKAIGVGQYQHDLKQNELTAALDGVVEQCVNQVGVEVSTASAELLSHVAGIGPALAKNIVAYREENGIASRATLKKVPKLGPKAFEQCAGFLRVMDSKNPLDATAVHPESYDAAKLLLEKLGYDLKEIRGGAADVIHRASRYGHEKLAQEIGVGLPTLNDMLAELAKPGRDPRDELPKPVLRTDVLEMKDLKPGMELTGTVRNVIDFGAFVDIGVHQDGLVHISRMAEKFIRHPSEVVKVGDIVKVWVVSVDEQKKRIALTMVQGRM
uniref:Transcription accessory protein n=1 Tax=uncultured bacterium Contigcl_1774 TaxID=1393661 RepID=W0FSS8_9BACT|nr:transcription accessory protein [uncultured bacterium Contigcl_1774]